MQLMKADILWWHLFMKKWNGDTMGYTKVPIMQILECTLMQQAHRGAGYISNSNGSIFFGNTCTVVVKVFNSISCRDNHLIHLICLLVFLASYHNFWFTPATFWLSEGKQNRIHKQIHYSYRNNYSQVPQTLLEQPRIPRELVTLVARNLTWTSTAWDSACQHYYSPALAASTIKTYKATEQIPELLQ